MSLTTTTNVHDVASIELGDIKDCELDNGTKYVLRTLTITTKYRDETPREISLTMFGNTREDLEVSCE